MKKKILCALLASLTCASIAVGLTACGNDAAPNTVSSEVSEEISSVEDTEYEIEETKSERISASMIHYELVKATINGKEQYALKITNNSEVPILGSEVRYKPKENITVKKLKKTFMSYLEGHEEYVSWKNFHVFTKNDKLIRPGESAIGDRVYLCGYSGTSNKKLLDWFEPSSFNFVYIKGGIVYTMSVNPKTGESSSTKADRQLAVWKDLYLHKKLPKPKADGYLVASTNDKDSLWLYYFGTTSSDCLNYVKRLKKSGYENDIREYLEGDSPWFHGTNDKGYEASARYYDTEGYMVIEVKKE